MPKKWIVKNENPNISPTNIASNIAFALAECIGSSVEYPSSGTMLVSFSSIGYSDLKMEIIKSPYDGNSIASARIISSSSTTQLESIQFLLDEQASDNSGSCYLVRDNNNDAIVANLHSGKTEYAGGSAKDKKEGHLSIFVGKDVDEGVLWGIGNGHIQEITNGSKIINLGNQMPRHPNISVFGGPSDVLQFVKMRNYLSDGYPEMKAAYTTITRTIEPGNRGNLSFYADGSLWGYGGWGDFTTALYEIDPWVKY